MTKTISELRDIFGRDGGMLGRIEWLHPDGSVAYDSPEFVVFEMLIDRDRIAWLDMANLKPVLSNVRTAERDADEFIVTLEPGDWRIVLGPLWNAELLKQLDDFQRNRHILLDETLVMDMRQSFEFRAP